MLRPRVMPVLLLKNRQLVKTVKFKNPSYVGDPINAVKIFNEKEVDELVVLDISATEEGRPPDFEYVATLAGECFMPVCYGGGVQRLEAISSLLSLGVERVSVNTAAAENPDFVAEAAREFGSSTLVVSLDVRRDLVGRQFAFGRRGRKRFLSSLEAAKRAESEGAGEILLTSIERDGTYSGFDVDLIKNVTAAVGIPVIACGGAAGLDDLRRGLEAGAAAVAAGSLFVYYGRNRAVLINYPTEEEIEELRPKA